MKLLLASPFLRSSLLAFVLSAASVAAPAAGLDTTADAVLGQASLVTNNVGNGASGLNAPVGVAVDRVTGRIYVADYFNNRVMSWPNATSFTNGQAADLALGQPDLVTTSPGVTATKMNQPISVAVDLAGNLYVADFANNRVLLFPFPQSTGMAATRVIGQPDFTTSTTNTGGISCNRLSLPNGVAVDGRGNLFVADAGNHRVLGFVSPITTVQGMPAQVVYGQLNCTGNLANQGIAVGATTLNFPRAVAFDPAGNMWVSDEANDRVLQFVGPSLLATGNPFPEVTADLVLGQPNLTTGTANAPSQSTLGSPRGIAFDSSGTAYVSDLGANRILRFTPPFTSGMNAGVVFGQPNFTTTAAGTSADALSSPFHLAVDGLGNLFATDYANNRVLRFDQPRSNGSPTVSTLSPAVVPVKGSDFVLTVNGSGFIKGSVVNYNGSARTTYYISEGRLLALISSSDIATLGSNAITVFNPTPGGGTSAGIPLTVYARASLDRPADRLWGQPDFTQTDYDNPRVGEERLANVAAAGLDAPGGVAVDPVSGRMFIADQLNSRVLVFAGYATLNNTQSPIAVLGQPNEFTTACNAGNTDASASTLCLSGGSGIANGIAVDNAGALYVPDSGNHRVLQFIPPFTTGMAAARVFGQDNFVSRLPNNGGTSASRMSSPRGVMIGAGTMWVADAGNNRILGFVNPYADAVADVVLGQTDFFSSTAGTSASKLSGPQALAMDGLGRILVADSTNNRVIRFSPPFSNGMAADTVLGQIDFVSATASTTAASFNLPTGVAVDAGGGVLVADRINNRVLRFAPPISSAMNATGVLGQSSFTTATIATSTSGLWYPTGVAVDKAGTVFIADWWPGRVLAYDRPFPTPVQKVDVSGDGKSDLVWRASDGGLSLWTMNGATVTGYNYGVVSTQWFVIASADFNGDGKADLLWRRGDGATYIWFMDGRDPVGFADTGVVPLEYTPVAAADFNGDGYADILFRRSNGQNYMWLMNNGAITSQGFLPGSLPAEWVVVGADDLNGDGKADILWRNGNTGDTYVWAMNGTSLLSSTFLGAVGLDWQIAGLADFNGDGIADIPWRRNNGDQYLWLMGNSGVMQYLAQPSLATDWVVQGYADFNGDGKADIIYRNSTTGEVYVWIMEVNAPTSGFSLGNPGAIWSLALP